MTGTQVSVSEIVGSPLVKAFSERYKMEASPMLLTLSKTAFKQKDNAVVTTEQMTMLLVVADQYKLNPFTKEIYAYPDKGSIVPIVSIDGWVRIINEHPQMDGLEFAYSEKMVEHNKKTAFEWVECSIYRKDRSKPVVVREYFDEVVNAKYPASPWNSHPKRMHRHKVLIQASRIAFGFAGIFDQDEGERIIDVNDEPTNYDQSAPAAAMAEESEIVIDYYSEEEFEAKAPKWQKAIENGLSAIDLINTVESKAGSKNFSVDQAEVLKSYEVVEGELVQ